MTNDFPLIEFDANPKAVIEPSEIIKPIDIAKTAVLCFFDDAIETYLEKTPSTVIAHFIAASMKLPIYDIAHNGVRLALVQAAVGAPVAVAQIEELHAMGCKKFIICGGCGVLNKEIAAGHLIIPTAALRDEGTSFHYAPPSREIQADDYAVAVLEKVLQEKQMPYIKGKTWTTDAFYRETADKVKRRRGEGCITVEMEASALMAVAQFRKVTLGQLLYAGDSLGGETWDSRDWHKRYETRALVLQLALDAAAML